MIQASELRIGNWVDVTNTHCQGNYGQIDQLLKYERASIARDGHSCSDGVELEFIKPIPLTSGWLKQLGFSQEWDEVYGEVEQWRKGPIVWSSSDQVAIHGNWDAVDADIRYVHQLQNLYFALTGEEIFQGEGLTHPIID